MKRNYYIDLYGCFRLAPRIRELRNEGMKISTEKGSGNYAVYRLERPGQMDLFNERVYR